MNPPQPSGLSHGLPLWFADDWTHEQAMAVIELLDDLRERIWSHYGVSLQERYRWDRLTQQPVLPEKPPF